MIPFDRIDTLSLDVGNTLICIDFDCIAEGLGFHGFAVEASVLCRAEAAARPMLSKTFSRPATPGGLEPFFIYLQTILSHLPDPGVGQAEDVADLVSRAAPGLRGDRSSRLWRLVMPGVREALAIFQQLGLRLVVVSNSDGTVEQALVAAGLRPSFAAVIDSAVVGFEKPDPRIFLHALERVGAEADRTLHVGDLYDADVLGARAAGLHALLLDPFEDWKDIDCAVATDLLVVANRFQKSRGRGV